MSQTEKQFFNAAVVKSGAINASGFARKLGVSPASISEWKKGKTYPSDKTMLKIAMLCDLDPVEALALLNLWRCDDTARSTYQRLLEAVQSTALKCFPYTFALALASQAYGLKPLEYNETSPAKISHNYTLSSLCDLYIVAAM